MSWRDLGLDILSLFADHAEAANDVLASEYTSSLTRGYSPKFRLGELRESRRIARQSAEPVRKCAECSAEFIWQIRKGSRPPTYCGRTCAHRKASREYAQRKAAEKRAA